VGNVLQILWWWVFGEGLRVWGRQGWMGDMSWRLYRRYYEGTGTLEYKCESTRGQSLRSRFWTLPP
jgi:hypothetical protein